MNFNMNDINMGSLRGSSVRTGTIRRRVAWPLRKDDTCKSRNVNNTLKTMNEIDKRVSGGTDNNAMIIVMK